MTRRPTNSLRSLAAATLLIGGLAGVFAAPPPSSAAVPCDTHVSNAVNGTYVAPATGHTCIQNAQISGNLVLPAGAHVGLGRSTVGGSVMTTGRSTLWMCGTTVSGSVILRGGTEHIIGDFPRSCDSNEIFGNVQLASTTSGLRMLGNKVAGSVSISGTTGGDTVIGGNTVTGYLSCYANTPAATNGGFTNTAGARNGECGSPWF